MLAMKRGELRRLVAAAVGAVASHAGGNAARLFAASIELLAGSKVGRIRFQTRVDQTIEVGGKIRHILRAQGRRHRHHDGAAAFAVLEILQLLDDVVGTESGETRPIGIDAVAVCAMTAFASGCLARAGFGVAGGQSRSAGD